MKLKNRKYVLLLTLTIIFFIYTKFISFSKYTYSPKNINNINVHFIDVGQGDAILIQVNNKNIIIDSGPKDNEINFFSYLDSLKIKRIDYIIATHPHEDHIGNMAKLIKKYDIDYFYAPKIIHSSKSFEKMVEALIEKNKKINVLKAGIKSIDLGDDSLLTVISPNKDYYGDNLNLYSPIIKLQYKEISFLFTGDAEEEIEKEVILLGSDISADVLKIGHHGSSTSTSEVFLNNVNPTISVISVGENNEYNHPSDKVLSLLKNQSSLIFRTDINGTIIVSSNGTTLSVNTEKTNTKW